VIRMVLIVTLAVVLAVVMHLMVTIKHGHHGKGLRGQPQHNKDQNKTHRVTAHVRSKNGS